METQLSVMVRKLRKKLRQIESLEHLQRNLSESELRKVSCKRQIRSELKQLLSQPQTKSDALTGSEEAHLPLAHERKGPVMGELKRSLPLDEPCPRTQDAMRNVKKTVPVPEKQSKSSPSVDASAKGQKEPGNPKDPFVAQRRAWQDARFHVRQLVGHADLITAVLLHGSSVISASRDTTVKVWDVPTGTEEMNLAGHQGAVTCLTAIPPIHAARLAAELGVGPQEQFVASGSTDCSIIIWALERGAAVQNIYTFCGLSSLCCMQESGLLVAGSEAGKVEVWDPLTKESQQSERAHEDAVTALQEQAGYLFSGSADGSVKVWQLRKGTRLSLVYASENTTSQIRSVRCMATTASADRLFFGNDGTSVKVLSWRTGLLSRLTNHLTDSGFVDSVRVTSDGVLVATGFNIDLGHGYLSVRNVETGEYLGTLAYTEAPRLLCLETQFLPGGMHRWVTGGKELLLWEQVPSNSGDGAALKMTYWSAFERKAAESASEVEEDSEISDGEDEDEDTLDNADGGEKLQENSKSWLWCALI